MKDIYVEAMKDSVNSIMPTFETWLRLYKIDIENTDIEYEYLYFVSIVYANYLHKLLEDVINKSIIDADFSSVASMYKLFLDRQMLLAKECIEINDKYVEVTDMTTLDDDGYKKYFDKKNYVITTMHMTFYPILQFINFTKNLNLNLECDKFLEITSYFVPLYEELLEGYQPVNFDNVEEE